MSRDREQPPEKVLAQFTGPVSGIPFEVIVADRPTGRRMGAT